MEKLEQLFIKGFNNGYMLAKHEPQMLDTLLREIRPNSSYIDGMKGGQLEYQQERLQNRVNEINQLNKTNSELDIDRE